MRFPIFGAFWAFPNFIAGLPFLRYFNDDRTEWMVANGFETGEMKESLAWTVQILIAICIVFIIVMPLVLIKDYIITFSEIEQEFNPTVNPHHTKHI